MLWTISLCFLVLWLLALLLERGEPWVHVLPLAIAALLIFRLVGTALRR